MKQVHLLNGSFYTQVSNPADNSTSTLVPQETTGTMVYAATEGRSDSPYLIGNIKFDEESIQKIAALQNNAFTGKLGDISLVISTAE